MRLLIAGDRIVAIVVEDETPDLLRARSNSHAPQHTACQGDRACADMQKMEDAEAKRG
jgi:hypothetical protein